MSFRFQVSGFRFQGFKVAGSLIAVCWGLTAGASVPSMLPEGRGFKLVWSDEFEGTALDMSKWNFRTNFWGKRANWFAAPEDGAVTVKDGCAHLRIVQRPDGSYCSAQLQTGGALWDELNPRTGYGVVWPFHPREKPKFLHRYGY